MAKNKKNESAAPSTSEPTRTAPAPAPAPAPSALKALVEVITKERERAVTSASSAHAAALDAVEALVECTGDALPDVAEIVGPYLSALVSGDLRSDPRERVRAARLVLKYGYGEQ